MPARALLLCSVAAVFGTLAVSPVALDLRLIAGGAIVAGAVAMAALSRPTAMLAFVGFVLAAAINAELHARSEFLSALITTVSGAGSCRKVPID